MRRAGLILLSLMLWALPARAQVPQEPYTISASSALEICRPITLPAGQKTVIVYGIHVSNTDASARYLQLFNATAQPAGATVPLGASSWSVPAAADKDISIGELMGLNFTVGVEACLSTTQATFTAPGAVGGFIIEYR